MSLFKRKDSPYWWIKLSVSGRRIQKSTGTEDQNAAQEYHDRLKVELWEQSHFGVKPNYPWKKAVLRWLKETSHKATHADDVWILRGLDSYLRNVKLSEINRDKIEEITAARLDDGVENGTVNRMLAVLRAILRRAMDEWEWLDRVPKVRMLPVAKRRIRYLTHPEAEVLLEKLPAHLASMVQFSLETGLRQSNVTELQWSQVDVLQRLAWIHPDQAKARKAISVPLSDVAITVIRQQIRKHPVFVFCYRGEPVKQVNTKAWKRALKEAGITDFRWHDIRHTWATWHVQQGTPLNALQELGGWESVEMVRRYAHFNSEHLSSYVSNMTEKLKPVATKKLRLDAKGI